MGRSLISEAQVQTIHELARATLDAGFTREADARAWLVARQPRLRWDLYFQHVFFDVWVMQMTYRKLRGLSGGHAPSHAAH